MYKGVLVTDAETRHPPLVHIRHIAVSYMHTAPTAGGGVVAVVEELEAVEVMQIPADGGIGSVNFKRVQRFVAAGIPRGFKLAEGAINKVLS